jgi:hypothetical protein
MDAEHSLVHGFKDGQTKKLSDINSLEDMSRADANLRNSPSRRSAS